MALQTETDTLKEPLFTGQTIHLGDYPNSSVATAKRLVEKSEHERHAVFCELMELEGVSAGMVPNYHWTESARWIKYEETVEGTGKRWSKPHVTITSIAGLLKVRNCLKRGATIFDMERVTDFEDILVPVLDIWLNNGQLHENNYDKVFDALVAPKQHLYRSEFRDRNSHSQEDPTADREYSKRSDTAIASKKKDFDLKGPQKEGLRIFKGVGLVWYAHYDVVLHSWDFIDQRVKLVIEDEERGETLILPTLPKTKSDIYLDQKASVVNGATHEPVNDDFSRSSVKASVVRQAVGILKRMPEGSEAANILVGRLPELQESLTAFVRFAEAVPFDDMPEVSIPTRFVAIILAPMDFNEAELLEVGKCIGVVLVDEVFSKVAYQASDAAEICQCIDEFLGQTLLIPPARWSKEFRLEPSDHEHMLSRALGGHVNYAKISSNISLPVPLPQATAIPITAGLQKSGKLFGGLVADIRRKSQYYWSDFRDAFRVDSFSQCLAVTMFLFFANFTKVISFGGIMEVMLGEQMAAMENIMSGSISGVLYALFSGQPLSVLSVAGPVLVFETALYHLCIERGIKFLAVRFWMGFWTAIFMLVIVATDSSVLASWITRFTEDSFSMLVSIIFIVSATREVIHISQHHPITPDWRAVLADPCVCKISSDLPKYYELDHETNSSLAATSVSVKDESGKFFITIANLSVHECHEHGGESQGQQCGFLPDVFLFSFILFVSTFLIAFYLKQLKDSGYFPAKVRNSLSEFGVAIAVVSMTTLTYFVGLDVPKLHVPSEIAPTLPRRWFINPFKVKYWWIPLASVIPALLFTILVVMDQHITAVILNRRENKLKKGYGYHLDLAVLSCIFIICGLMGIPYYVAGTVVAIMHVESLKVMSDKAAPGEKPQFLGIREQRVTALVAHLLIGCSVFLTPTLRLIPLPVLLGIVLYIGIASLAHQQFVERLLILFMPVKYQPDYKFLRLVPVRRVHLFTAVQLAVFTVLLAVQYITSISIFFPIMLLMLVTVRKTIIERMFTPQELMALDNLMPTWSEMKKQRMVHGERRRSSTRRQTLVDHGHQRPMLNHVQDEHNSR